MTRSGARPTLTASQTSLKRWLLNPSALLLLELEGLIRDVRAALRSEWAAYTKLLDESVLPPTLVEVGDGDAHPLNLVAEVGGLP